MTNNSINTTSRPSSTLWKGILLTIAERPKQSTYIAFSAMQCCTQATNGSNSSVTINGYTLSIGAPAPGTAFHVSGPAPSPAVPDVHTRRRLLMSTKSSGLGYKETCPSTWQQLWHQMLGSAGGSLESHGQGLLALGQYLWQMPRQAWSTASNMLSNHLLGHSVKSAAQSRVHAYATVLYQRASQVLVSPLHVKGVLQASVAKASDRTGRFGGRENWRILASSDDSGVDIDVTVDVPSGQDGSAALESPSFAPALQQSLSNQGAKHQQQHHHSAESALCVILPCCPVPHSKRYVCRVPSSFNATVHTGLFLKCPVPHCVLVGYQ